MSARTLTGAEIDPLWETADADRANNAYPRRIEQQTLRLSGERPTGENRMRDSDVEVSPDSTATRSSRR